jgi:outer membrane protein
MWSLIFIVMWCLEFGTWNFKYRGGFMKKIFFAIVLTLFAYGANATDLKIAYVDLNKALNESDEGKKAVKELEGIVKGKQKLIDKKGVEIKKLDEEIAKQASILNPDALKEKQGQREKLLRDYQRMIKDSQDEVQKKQADFMKNIIVKLRKVVAKIGEEEGYTLIFERAESGILYIPRDVDLTEKLIKRFNESTKSDESQEQDPG